jgi:hypothetical protein
MTSGLTGRQLETKVTSHTKATQSPRERVTVALVVTSYNVVRSAGRGNVNETQL